MASPKRTQPCLALLAVVLSLSALRRPFESATATICLAERRHPSCMDLVIGTRYLPRREIIVRLNTAKSLKLARHVKARFGTWNDVRQAARLEDGIYVLEPQPSVPAEEAHDMQHSAAA